jgi:signal transduction histidine kinase
VRIFLIGHEGLADEIPTQLDCERYHVNRLDSATQAVAVAPTCPPDVALLSPCIAADPLEAQAVRLLRSRFGVALVCAIPALDTVSAGRARELEPHGYLALPVQPESVRAAIELAVLMRDTARDQERMVTSVAHELRTPLAAIIGFADSFLLGLHGELTEDQARHMRTIQAAGEHLLSIADHLVDLAKLGAADFDLHIEPVSCAQIIREVTDALAPLAARKGLHLEVPLAPPELRVLADRRALAQILYNLIGNALKFTTRGAVAVHCGRGAHDASRVFFEVRDTGPGISGGMEHARGKGFGLELAARLAGRMNGTIRAEATGTRGAVGSADATSGTAAAPVGAGTVITLDLPGVPPA